MVCITEKQLDTALANALSENQEFLNWFLSHTKFATRSSNFHSCRSDNPWGAHPYSETDEVTGVTETSTRQSETDVLLLVADENNHVLAIHIENKLASGKFTDRQAQMYAQRAAHWVGKPRYGNYSEFETVLLAPQVFKDNNSDLANRFGCFISHEQVAQHIPLFAKVTD